MPELREQRRARAALKTVQGLASKPDSMDYRQVLQHLPSRILASGLGQTLAFAASKGGKEVAGTDCLARFLLGDNADTKRLLEVVMAGSASEYRAHTREALAYSEWLKRYAAALIMKKD